MKQGSIFTMEHIKMISDSPDTLKQLILSGELDVDSKSVFFPGSRLLHFAVHHSSNESLTYLLELKANPNVFNVIGETPLHLAAEYGRLTAIPILLRYGASLKLKNDSQKTPVMHARHWAKDACADMLLDYEERIDSAKLSVFAFLLCCKRTRVLHKDIIVVIAKQVWETRLDEAWQTKRSKKCIKL